MRRMMSIALVISLTLAYVMGIAGVTLAVNGPVISDVSANVTGETTATITWITDQPATSQVEYGLATAYGWVTPLDAGLATGHSADLDGLTPGTTYHYRVRSMDASDNETISEDHTFTTLDLTAPLISDVTAIGITATGATITWTTDEPATSQVEYGLTESYGEVTPLDVGLVTGHSVNLSGLSDNTTYHYMVISVDAWDNEAISDNHTFTTAVPPNNPPGQPANVSPSPGQTDVSLTPTLQSSAFSDPDAGDTHAATQWQITHIPGDYSNPAFDSGTDTANLTTITIPYGSVGHATYHWRVRHQDDHEAWSDWSVETSFTTIPSTNRPPAQPGNLSPAAGSTGTSLVPTLSASAFSDPDAGDIHMASQWQIKTASGGYSDPVYDSGSTTSQLTAITIPSGELGSSTTYYWRVRYQEGNGTWSEWSVETSFTTAAPPNQPVNITPAAGATDVGLTPSLSSSTFSDPDPGDTHAASQWQITAVAGDYSSPVFDSAMDTANITSISIPSGILSHSTTYYWRVRHQDNHAAWSAYSAETAFTSLARVSQPPAQPGTSTPADGATGVSLTPTLTSSAFSDPDAGDTHAASQWQVRTGSGTYTSPVFDRETSAPHLTSIGIPSGTLEHSTTYCWSVRYKDSTGAWSDWSAEICFTTGKNGEVGGCCSSSNVSAAPGDIAIAWGALGLCSATGLLFARRLGRRKKS